MARKAKPTQPSSAAVQEYIKAEEAKREAAGKPAGPAQSAAPRAGAPAPPPAPGSAPPTAPLDPIAAARLPVAPRPLTATPARSGLRIPWWPIALGVFAVVIFVFFTMVGRSATGTPKLGSAEISQLRQGMTPEQAQAVLGKPKSARKGPTTRRESTVDSIDQAGYYEYYRSGTLMLVYDKTNQQLIEVCIGETPDEYTKRKDKKEKVLWEEYPDTGFVHQDVWRPNQTM